LDAPSLPVREEFEQEIMVHYRTEYMVGGNLKVAIESD
jgi:hypothetical protein